MLKKIISKIPFLNRRVQRTDEVNNEVKNAMSRTIRGMEQTMNNSRRVQKILKDLGIESDDSRDKEAMNRMYKVNELVNKRN